MELTGKRIILGITGSIAAYKAAYLLRLLSKEGATVQVVMTPSAREFIGPVTLSALSGNPVLSDFFKPEGGDWNSHVELGIHADLMIVAPATVRIHPITLLPSKKRKPAPTTSGRRLRPKV